MLHQPPVHIGDVKPAVGRSGQVDGAETFVGGSQEFPAGMRVESDEHKAVFADDVSLDEVAGGFAHKGITQIFRRKSIFSIDQR